MKILVVDDEPDVRLLFEQRFRREIRSGEFEFSFAYSGEEALTFLRDHPSQVVLILSDINMPGMSGLELPRHVKTDPLPPPAAVGDDAHGLRRHGHPRPGYAAGGQ